MPGANAQIDIVDFAFNPATLTVATGASVTWKNGDGVAHSIRSKDAAFDEQRMESGATAMVTFSKPGSYAYVCGIHNSMTGTIVVQP